MRILFYGDVVGLIGRKAIKLTIENLIKKYRVDFVIANGENASHGKGLTESNYDELISYGVNSITLGNHYFSKDQIASYIDDAELLVRPVNVIKPIGGSGSRIFDVNGINVRVTNILGTSFMEEEVKTPYLSLQEILEGSPDDMIHIVDYHGEATGEKQCFGYLFDGKVSAIIGTHTHVQTKDSRILPKGTGFISDVGMCGGYNSVLGFVPDTVIKKTIFGEKSRFEPDDKDDFLVSAVIIDIDNQTHLCKEIFPIYQVSKGE